ncbi:hypothetical protein GGD54_005124 [Rhizobium tropici]|uniref:Uncharacterized protein n=1 Tax=Rhizobium tropici TaxID=398 RepID=A0ABR6R681_RHITR|nr:hypothetical protein [Rhizobium tropici]MBB5595460.1 hypothetical protein [Rhizobium tropici]MBB6494696.1 hypothetical protein [Rhizobium tropici]
MILEHRAHLLGCKVMVLDTTNPVMGFNVLNGIERSMRKEEDIFGIAHMLLSESLRFGASTGSYFRRIEIELAVEPVAPTLQKVGALLLQCMCGLFLNVQPRFRSQTSSPRPMETAFCSANRRTISFSVMSFSSSIMPTM